MPYLAIFTGNAHPELAKTVADHLHIPLGKADITRFSDGEIAVEIKEHVRGKDVFIMQPTCAPTNDNLMEIMMMADALRRSSAGRITAVMPYLVMRVRIVARAQRVYLSQQKSSLTC